MKSSHLLHTNALVRKRIEISKVIAIMRSKKRLSRSLIALISLPIMMASPAFSAEATNAAELTEKNSSENNSNTDQRVGVASNELKAEPKSQPLTLPNPLRLPELLSDYASLSPDINLQQAGLQMAESNKSLNQVNNNLELNLLGRLGRREFAEENLPYNFLALHVGKVIYDFGRNDSQFEADSKLTQQAEVALKNAENRQKLEVAKSYFNVLLADFQYRIDNEAMAIDYISFDKVSDRHEIGQLSDVDLLEAEHNYQLALLKRSQSEQAQLKTRVALANTLGLPNARPDELKFPKLNHFEKRSIKSLSLEKLQTMVLDKNPQIQQWLLAEEAQQQLLQKAQDVSKPTVRADAWVGHLSSQPEDREGRWKAQISVDIPLYDGGSKDSQTALAKAELLKIQAQKQRLEQQLRNQVADIFFQIKLLDTEKKVHQAFGDYADLYLDFSRALYENESRTDLGDSFVRLSEANFNMVAWQFKQALLWMELDYLMGSQVSLDNPNTLIVENTKGKE